MKQCSEVLRHTVCDSGDFDTNFIILEKKKAQNIKNSNYL